MDYKEKYEQAMFRMNKWAEGSEITDPKEVAEFVFPELKESEDEKTRKSLISYLHGLSEFAYKCADEVQYRKGYEDAKREFLKQDEQKPICKLDNSYTCVKFPFKAKVKSTGTIVTIYDGQLGPDGKKWITYQSDLKDGYKVYEPDNLELVCEIEQKPACSEEDEEMLEGLNNCLSELEEKNGWRYVYVNNKDIELCEVRNWLKSLKERMNNGRL